VWFESGCAAGQVTILSHIFFKLAVYRFGFPTTKLFFINSSEKEIVGKYEPNSMSSIMKFAK